LVFTVLADNNPFITIERNDIVVVQNDQMKDRLIKRVIAIPGDTLEIKDNQIYLNGECLKEPFVLEPMVIDDIPKHKLKDEYFVMGDNRNISKDSRQLGGFAKEDIFGVVQVTNPIANVALLIIVIMVMYGMGEVSLFLSQKITQRWMPLPESDPDVTSESESDPKEDEAEHVLHGDQ
jgi:signal peptidase I